MRSFTVAELFEIHAKPLALQWIEGQEGAGKLITSENIGEPSGDGDSGDDDDQRSQPIGTDPRALTADIESTGSSRVKSLVGHLNLIHPNQVQVLGNFELQYLSDLRNISRADAFQQLFALEPSLILIGESQQIPKDLRARCREHQVPLFSSPHSSDKLTETLHYHLANHLAEVITLHGVFMEVTAIGVLLTGSSGVGKSELALELITRGHRLVADDAPQFAKLAPDIINGTCPTPLQDFLEVRGLGFVNVRELFGDSAIKRNKYLRLIIRLERLDPYALSHLDRLQGSYRSHRIFDMEVPEITLPVASGRNLAVLVECAARNHLLRTEGYDSSQAFIERQRRIMAEEQSR